MKLFYSVNSPYSRKCRIVAMEKGLKLDQIMVNPMENPPELLAVNPLGTVPALVTDRGLHLCESPVICEYLDSLTPDNKLYPSESRECVLAVAALADGIMDAAVSCVLESRKMEEKRSPEWVSRKQDAILRAIEKCSSIEWQTSPLTIGTISLAVALAYVSFRLPHVNWRASHPALAKWFDEMSKRPSFAATVPVA